jgi:hypothetical protein
MGENDMTLLAAKDLALGHIVQIRGIESFGTAMVTGISEDLVELTRPYGHVSTMACSGKSLGPNGLKITPYLGWEVWQESRRDTFKRFTIVRKVVVK